VQFRLLCTSCEDTGRNKSGWLILKCDWMSTGVLYSTLDSMLFTVFARLGTDDAVKTVMLVYWGGNIVGFQV
jgi:hypothetical protein